MQSIKSFRKLKLLHRFNDVESAVDFKGSSNCSERRSVGDDVVRRVNVVLDCGVEDLNFHEADAVFVEAGDWIFQNYVL